MVLSKQLNGESVFYTYEDQPEACMVVYGMAKRLNNVTIVKKGIIDIISNGI